MSTKALTAAEVGELLGVATAATAVISRVSGLEVPGRMRWCLPRMCSPWWRRLRRAAGLILARHVGAET